MNYTCRRTQRVIAMLLAGSLVALPLAGCQASQQSTDNQSTTTQTSTETTDSFTSHGSSYGKSETVKVTTDLNGNMQALSVEDWIKNPNELATIDDVTTLSNVKLDKDSEGVTGAFAGDSVTWTTGGKDVTYTGTTDKALPFDISYCYWLDGEEVDPSEITNATGELKITISYRNNTRSTYTYNGTRYQVEVPYVMASIISFDPEHAQNIDIDNGTVMDMNGATMAVGLGLPGLASTLDLGDTVSLPESVTITADVKGFDMPSITTMVTDQMSSALTDNSGDLKGSLADTFDSLSQLETAFDTLATANTGLSTGLSQISTGADAMATNLPTAGAGLSNFATAASGINALATKATSEVVASEQSSSAALASIEILLEQDAALSDDDPAKLTKEQRETLESAKTNLIAASEQNAAATGDLSTNTQGGKPANITATSAQLSTGLTTVSENFTQVVTAAQTLSTALKKMGSVSSTLATGTTTMSENITTMLDSAQDTINGKLDQMAAMGAYAKSEGAYAGSASGMEASTLFTVTAKN